MTHSLSPALRAWRGLPRVVLAFGLALVGQVEIAADRPDNGLALLLAAVILYAYSGPTAPRDDCPSVPHAWPGDVVLRSSLPGLVAAALLAVAALHFWGITPGHWFPWAIYLFALALLAIEACRLGTQSRTVPGLSGWEWAAVAAILAWGAFLRLYRLDVFPPGVYYDEATNAMEALRALHAGEYPAYFAGSLGYYGRFGTLYEYFVGAMLELGGINEVVLRLTAVFPGMLALPVFYLLARRWFPRSIALVALFLLANSRWHANFSRIAFDAILMPTLLAAAAYFLVRSIQTRRWSGYIWSGLFLGLGLLTYTAFRLAPAVLVGIILAYAITRRLPWRQAVIGLLLLIVATGIATAPEVQHYLDAPASFTERTEHLSIWRDRSPWEARADIADSVRRHLGMFHFAGDRNGRHNLPSEPMLAPITGVLFLFGVAAALRHLRHPLSLLLLGWLAVMLSAGIFSIQAEAPQALRTIGSIPAVYLLATWPLADFAGRWRTALGTRLLNAALPLALVSGALMAAGTYHTFFIRQAGDFTVWASFSTSETRMAYSIRANAAGRALYVDPLLYDQPTLALLVPGFQEPEPFVALELLPLQESGSEGALVFVREQHSSIGRLLEDWYPSAQAIYHSVNPEDRAAMYEYRFTAEDIASVRGLTMSVQGAGQGLTVPDLSYDVSPGATSLYLTWSGVLLVPDSGWYAFAMEVPGAWQLHLGGTLVAQSDGAPLEVYLPRGRVALMALAEPSGPGPVSLQWQTPGTDGFVSVPADRYYHAPITGGGLQGDYLAGAGDDWQAQPAFSRNDPVLDLFVHRMPLPRPYRVRWSGTLLPPIPGEYELALSARNRAELWLGGAPVLQTVEPDKPISLTVALSGPTPIEIRFWDESSHSRITLRWRPPDSDLEVIPTSALLPSPPITRAAR